jgi:hypothetical protein
MSVRALAYTTPRLRTLYELQVIGPRLRGEERNVVVRQLNAQQQRNNARMKQRQEKRDRDEALRLAEISAKTARDLAEKERKKEQKRLEENAKRRAKRAFSKIVKEVAVPRAMPFARLRQWGDLRTPAGPFSLTLRSGNSNITRTFRFNSREHFMRWLDAIDAQNTVQDSENYQDITDLMGADRNVFRDVIPSVEVIRGGCRTQGKEKNVVDTPFHTLTVFSPVTKHNNCGFKVLEHILGDTLNYAEERKIHGIPYDGMVSVDVIQKIYRQRSSRILVVIDDTFSDEFDFKHYDYILVDHDHYSHVMGAVSKTFKNEKTKRGYVYWDIETRPSTAYVMVGENKSYLLEPVILCAYYKNYQSEEFHSLTFTSRAGKNCCRQFLDWLTVQASQRHFYHAIAHNGSRFDVYFLMSQLTREEQLHTEAQLRGFSVIGLQYKSHLFKDSCCFLTNSLDALCKSFKVKQAKLTEFAYRGKTLTNKNICFYRPELSDVQFLELEQKEPDFWALYVRYCEMDCISLSEIWSSFKTQYEQLTDKIFMTRPELKANVGLMNTNTIGSLAKKILENTCLRRMGGKYVKTQAYRTYLEFLSSAGVEDAEKITFVNEFKRGGISHTNQAGKHSHELISYDIASQYPASMMNMLIPCGKSEWVETYRPYAHGFYRVKNMVFTSSYQFKPIASKTEAGVLEWNNASIAEVCVDSFMIKYLQERYGLVSFDVVTGLVSRQYIKGSEIFGDYVDTLYGEKKRQDALKKADDEAYNPALRECIKLFLNSVSGKLVEDPSRYFKLQYTGESTLKLNGVMAEKIQEKPKLNTWVTAGVMVYSYSKRLLFEYVRCLPADSDDVIHIETDSIYFHKKNNEKFIQNVSAYKQSGLDVYPIQIGDELGNVKIEKDTDATSYFLGKKFYCIGDLYKIKGIPLKTIDEYGNDVVLVDQSLYDAVYNGETVRREFYTMKKSLYGESTQISCHKMSRCVRPAMTYKHYE